MKAILRIGEKEASDERILGSGQFVEQIIQESDLADKYRYSDIGRKRKAVEIVNKECRKQGVSVEALQAGSRRRQISRIRSGLSLKLVVELGLTLAETARLLGVTTSAVTRSIDRIKRNKLN